MVECFKALWNLKDINASSRCNVQGEAKTNSEIVLAIKEITATLVYVAKKLNQSAPDEYVLSFLFKSQN